MRSKGSQRCNVSNRVQWARVTGGIAAGCRFDMSSMKLIEPEDTESLFS